MLCLSILKEETTQPVKNRSTMTKCVKQLFLVACISLPEVFRG